MKVNNDSIEKLLNEAQIYQKEKNYNRALRTLHQVLVHDPTNGKALLIASILYRDIKKWSKAKKYAYTYIKFHRYSSLICEVLGDVNFFEGHYNKAVKWYKEALKEAQEATIQKLREKILETYELIRQKKCQTRLAIVVPEGSDNFTDDLVERLSKRFWVRKFLIPSRVLAHYSIIYKLHARSQSNIIKALLKHFPMHLLRAALNWADITWIEWANAVAALSSITKPKGKKLFIRLHRYEAFTEVPFHIDYRNVDGIIFVSKAMKNILESRGINLEGVSTKIVYNGIDLNKLKFKERTKGYNIGWAAYIIPRKNLHMALEIIRKLVSIDPNYKLHVAGIFKDPLYEIHIKHAIKQMKLENNVILYGWVDDIDQWWENKNYLLSTSIHEGHPYNIMEAMAKGIKPVIYNFYGAEELYEKRLLFNSVDEAVNLLMNDEYESYYYREYVKKKGWILENQAKAFADFIHSLIA